MISLLLLQQQQQDYTHILYVYTCRIFNVLVVIMCASKFLVHYLTVFILFLFCFLFVGFCIGAFGSVKLAWCKADIEWFWQWLNLKILMVLSLLWTVINNLTLCELVLFKMMPCEHFCVLKTQFIYYRWCFLMQKNTKNDVSHWGFRNVVEFKKGLIT